MLRHVWTSTRWSLFWFFFYMVINVKSDVGAPQRNATYVISLSSLLEGHVTPVPHSMLL